jgi:AraC family transcriptional regulator
MESQPASYQVPTEPRKMGYVASINRVIDYIDANLSESLDLQKLAQVAHFSPWHFHRIFLALTGETLADCVRRRRLEKAARSLLMVPAVTAKSVAFDAGFGSAEVFVRTFKAHFGVTPGRWRLGANSGWADQRRSHLRNLHQQDRRHDQLIRTAVVHDGSMRLNPSRSDERAASMDVALKTMSDVRVAYMRYTGTYGDPKITRMWQRFASLAARNGLIDGKHMILGVSRDDPDIALAGRCGYDACVEVDRSFKPAGEIGVQVVRGGLFGCTPFRGTAKDIYEAWLQLFSGWLPDSGFQPDDRLAIETYGTGIEVDPETGRFACELCLPIRPL